MADKTLNTAPARLDKAFETEELDGLRLATEGRAISLTVIAVLLAFLIPWPGVVYVWLQLALFMAIAIAHYMVRRRGHGRVWAGYLFIGLDFCLLTYTLLSPNPLLEDRWPPQMELRNGVVVYYFLLVAAVSFSYTPRLMVWAGIAAAGAWSIGVGWIVAMPATVTPFHEIENATDAALLAQHLAPTFVDTSVWIQDVVLILLVAGTLAGVVARSRQLVIRQTEAARERTNLARYFPPTIVDRLAQLDQPLETVRAQPIAVMFVDIVGFTRMVQRSDPQDVIALLREYHAWVERAVFDNGGTLDKYLGDGVMATFGTPDRGERDAANALGCAHAMLRAADDWNATRRRNGLDAIPVSIGIHYGDVVLGDIGSERRLEFAVLGDVVNVASRLEELTRALGCTVVVSDALVTAARREAPAESENLLAGFADHGPHPLRGRDEEVPIWTLRAQLAE